MASRPCSGEVTRRGGRSQCLLRICWRQHCSSIFAAWASPCQVPDLHRDRKSTRLNSSHTVIYTLSLHDALPISARRSFPMSPEDLLEAALLIYLRGLGLTVPGAGSS